MAQIQINGRLQANQNLTTFNEGLNRSQTSCKLEHKRLAGYTTTLKTKESTQAAQTSYAIFCPIE